MANLTFSRKALPPLVAGNVTYWGLASPSRSVSADFAIVVPPSSQVTLTRKRTAPRESFCVCLPAAFVAAVASGSSATKALPALAKASPSVAAKTNGNHASYAAFGARLLNPTAHLPIGSSDCKGFGSSSNIAT